MCSNVGGYKNKETEQKTSTNKAQWSAEYYILCKSSDRFSPLARERENGEKQVK